ncbi:NTF2-like protein [Penicillium nucicola]|uniref:NTF2-like protein n=1 Tax=Penicillium nucicola TaxID=1850975 RepID=UPI002544FF94|nr:NTF2-like protein [Penicillium nucicola]KAJ5747329.1 NTF2-like protein [Penicillium nucicola]
MPAIGKEDYSTDAFIEKFLSPSNLGNEALLTQHLLGQPYFKSVSQSDIVVEWQQVASHGNAKRDQGRLSKKVSETSDGKFYMEQHYVKVNGQWKIAAIKPSLLFETGNFVKVRTSNE